MQYLYDIRCLIRSERTPIFRAAKNAWTKAHNEALSGDKMRGKIWGEREYKKSQEWESDADYDDALIKRLVSNFGKFIEKFEDMRAVLPYDQIEEKHFSLQSEPNTFADAIGYKAVSDALDGMWWEIVERDINEIKFKFQKRERLEDLDSAECYAMAGILGQVNTFYLHSYSDFTNEDLLLIRCPVRIKAAFPISEADDIYQIPVEAYVPHIHREKHHILTYTGTLYTNRMGDTTLRISNKRYNDVFEFRFRQEIPYKSGLFLGRSIYGQVTIVGPGVFVPGTEIFTELAEAEDYMRKHCKAYSESFDDLPPDGISADLWAYLKKTLHWAPQTE